MQNKEDRLKGYVTALAPLTLRQTTPNIPFMPIPIIQYKAIDGAVFSTESAAKRHESLLLECHHIDRMLPMPQGVWPSGTYIQHDIYRYQEFHIACVKLAQSVLPSVKDWPTDLLKVHPFGSVGRMLSNGPALTL